MTDDKKNDIKCWKCGKYTVEKRDSSTARVDATYYECKNCGQTWTEVEYGY